MTTKEKQAAIYTKNPATQTAAMIDAQAQLAACRQYCFFVSMRPGHETRPPERPAGGLV